MCQEMSAVAIKETRKETADHIRDSLRSGMKTPAKIDSAISFVKTAMCRQLPDRRGA